MHSAFNPADGLLLFSNFPDKAGNPFLSKVSGSEGKELPTVLVVDDERIIVDTLSEILNEHGFNASPAYSCDEALAKAAASPPDVVISDVVMPGQTGVDLGIAVRELFPPARVILLSGQAVTSTLLDKARDQGYEFELLAKPLHPRVLLELLSLGG
jgi:DNA-binding NtrC family response regulator